MTQSTPHPILTDRVRFGAAYYYEYHRPGLDPAPADLESDLDLMAAANFSVIRVGESVWTTWEPRDGEFDLDWLQPVLDGAHARGIDVILGTPTYAIPPWLVRRYPEIAADLKTGQPINWGYRQEVDYTHPAFKFYAERILRKIIQRYRDHPAVVGFQVDNEPGLFTFHNTGVFQRFIDELRAKYVTVDNLNREWGLTYWSHRLTDFSDLWKPDGNSSPQYDFAWRAYQTRLTTEMIGWQADLVREIARDDQFVTTCISYDRPGIDDVELTNTLDVTAGNPYYLMQDGFTLPREASPRQFWSTTGVAALLQTADRMYSSRGEPFLVTETNAQAIGGPHENHPAYPGQWRQAGWALVARGARMVEYWHWATLHYGTETYWGGVIPHSRIPGRTYREIAALGAELAAVGPVIADTRPDSDIAVLFSADAGWALAGQPPLVGPDGGGDDRSYHRIVEAFHRGAFDAGLQVTLAPPSRIFATDPADAVAQHPVLVAAGYYPAHDSDLEWLEAYARAGGHLVVGPRTGYADHEARARAEVAPPRLAAPAGVWYEEFTNLAKPVRVVGAGLGESPLALDESSQAEYWVECLQVGSPLADAGDQASDGAVEVLATYDDPHLGAWQAITTRPVGDGRITVVGTVPGVALAKQISQWLVPAPTSGWDAPETVTATTSTGPNGRVHVVHNWSWDAVSVQVPVDLELLTVPTGASEDAGEGGLAVGQVVRSGESVLLGAWDVFVAREAR